MWPPKNFARTVDLAARRSTYLWKSNFSNVTNNERKAMATQPTYEQAQLHLKVYNLRRETRLRQARDWFQQSYHAETMEEAMRIGAPGTEHGTFVGMVIGYWEQACALLNYGLLHEDLFFETSGEFFGVWERIKPAVAQGRQMWKNPHFLEHLEKAANRFETWIESRAPGHVAAMREFTKQMRGQVGKAA